MRVSSPSWAISSLTLLDALSVSVITRDDSSKVGGRKRNREGEDTGSAPGRHRRRSWRHRDQVDLARGAVDQAVELGDLDVAQLVDQALDEPAMHPAHGIGVGFGQRPKWAVRESDRGAVGVLDRLRVEAELGLLDDERVERGRARRPTTRIDTPLVAGDIGEVLAVEPAFGGGLQEHA